MENPLAVYLHDHMAGSKFAVELLAALRESNRGDSVGEAAQQLLARIEADRVVLERIIHRVGKSSPDVKTGLAWLSEKFARIKLGSGAEWNLATLEVLETIALGIRGKIALWTVLAAVEPSDERLSDEDYQGLIAEAKEQFRLADDTRMEVARALFTGSVRAKE